MTDDIMALAGLAAQRALGEGATVREIERWGGGAHNEAYKLRLADGRHDRARSLLLCQANVTDRREKWRHRENPLWIDVFIQ